MTCRAVFISVLSPKFFRFDYIKYLIPSKSMRGYLISAIFQIPALVLPHTLAS